MGLTAAIAGVSGYTGGELVRLISVHPHLGLAWVGGHGSAGLALSAVHPWIECMPGGGAPAKMAIASLDGQPDLSGIDVLFVSLPAGESSRFVASLEGGRPERIVDLGPDFRLPVERFVEWYGDEHPLADELGDWQYGFTEGFRSRIASSRHVANPGCYAMAALLALYPLASRGMIGDVVYVDGKSGLSGAGRSASERLLFSEASEDSSPYAVEGHRHQPEMEGTLRAFQPRLGVVFVPHLMPMARGLLVTAYVPLGSDPSEDEVVGVFSDTYATEPFVGLSVNPPHTKAVRGSNAALLHVALQRPAQDGMPVAVVTSAIDNLGKGAAGSAIQNANVMLGLDETAGLGSAALWP